MSEWNEMNEWNIFIVIPSDIEILGYNIYTYKIQ